MRHALAVRPWLPGARVRVGWAETGGVVVPPRQIFLGHLREIEWEKINERLSSAIMETCLALTIFREEFSVFFVAMFTVLTFIKVFHWLVQDRVAYMEVTGTPGISRLHHLRIVSFLAVLLVRRSPGAGYDVGWLREGRARSAHGARCAPCAHVACASRV